ncbi:cytochrome P450 [Phialemonium atrogriseum]|uniref:Cytochrome P450 n=1 Tax=Phialemonium atrogriseum TaxID=1093897 RepID=A0AAJ0BVX3_9PEZI|nr:cytochrome P450 [Phialemonium atrogriseum]KAK1764032.1 cytochrome P450 [Phialemonium atrogriseum]
MILNFYQASNIPFGGLSFAIPLLLLLLLLGNRVRACYKPGLRSLPGPFIASVTNLWRLVDVARGNHHDTLINLHRKYQSKLVRIGPNAVSVADPEAVRIIYGLKSGFIKTDFYTVQQSLSQGRPLENLFNTRNEDFHAAIRRPIANAYSMTTLLKYEPFVDTTSRVFLQRLNELYGDTGKACDLGTWLQYYAFDVIGEMTFSKRLGFLETGSDVGGIIKDLEWRLNYFAWCGQIPILDKFLVKSPIAVRMMPSNHVVKFTLDLVNDRLAHPSERQDFLDMFLKAKEEHPDLVNDRQVTSYSVTNIFAGSDTTAISLRSVFYHLLKNPPTLRKVVEEIDSAVDGRDCLQEPISFAESNKMPYLQAVLKEAMRVHPAVGLLLERLVPSGGCKIAGTWLPEGTTVGIDPWVLHRNKQVYGEDADVFRPERWLEADAETLKVMDRSFLAFGSGARTCIGRHISMLEMAKIVPQLLWAFELELENPKASWELHNYWFVRQTGLNVYLRKRPGRGGYLFA